MSTTRRRAMRIGSAALFAGLATTATARAQPSRPTEATPIEALQRRLTDLVAVRNQMENALVTMPAGVDYDVLNERLDANFEDCLAVQGEIAALPALSLNDVAIQCAIGFDLAICIDCVERPADGNTDMLVRILASILPVIANTADLDVDRLAWGDMGHLCAIYAPGGRAAA